MAKRVICTVIALVFIVSMVVIPTSADVPTSGTTESGYPIPELCARTNEPDVTNYCFELKRVLPGNVVKDGVIGEDEYYHLDIPRDEIILKGSNSVTGDAKTRSEAMKESAEAYVSWDYEHGVNFAVQYTSPETPVQQFSSLYYDGRVTPLPGSTKDNPLYNDSFNDDGSFKAIEENFWAQTAFTCQFSDKTGRCFYYCIGRNTETGEYLMGHYFFSDLSGQGWGQCGYDPTYIPVGGDDFVITYGPDNLVTMEWSVPFSTILGRDPVDGEKIGMSMTLTQGTNPPGYNPSDPDNLRDPWFGDLENNAAILFGNCAGFQSLAAKPTRTKTQKVYDPVTDQQITKKCAGNLPMVAIFNTAAPEGEEPEELTCTASLDLQDSIDLNLFVDGVTEEMVSGGLHVDVELNGEESTFYFSDTDPVYEGKYKFTVASYNATELDKQAEIWIYDGEGNLLKQIEYSPKAYADYVIADPDSDDGLIDVCGSLMAYGYFAQECFTPEEITIQVGDYIPWIDAVNESNSLSMGYYYSEVQKRAGVTGVGASLALKSKTELSYFVKGVSELNNVMVSVGDAPWDNYEVVTSATKCRVIVKGLRPVDLKSSVVLASDEAFVDYVPMACAQALVENGSEYANVCKALYRFSTAAIDFFGSVTVY